MPSNAPIDALEDIFENSARIERVIGGFDEPACCADDRQKRQAGTKNAKQATDDQNGGVVALTKELFQAAITLRR